MSCRNWEASIPVTLDARMIMVRASTAVFGRGSIEFLRPANHRILAYVRRLGKEAVLAVNNLQARPKPSNST